MIRARTFLFCAASLGLALLPIGTPAQTDERGVIVAFLEDSLSDAGRTVTITGFAGALSSVARLDSLTIADDFGVWITLTDVVLDWNRSALLSGEIQVNSLTAQQIMLDRLPGNTDMGSMPALEGSTFSLPDLPVSIEIGKIVAERIILAPVILGQGVTGSASAAVTLQDGEGAISLELDRLDGGPDGQLSLQAAFSNEDGQLSVSLAATEAQGGIAATLLGIPAAPSTALRIEGNGPLDGFDADLTLESGGEPRLGGTVTLLGNQDGGRDFALNIGGDLAPMLLPQYRDFLGDRLDLTAQGVRLSDGRIILDELALGARQMSATGSMAVAADGLPERFQLDLSIAGEGGLPVLLPLPGTEDTRVQTAQLTLGFDAAKSDAWSLDGLISGLTRPDVRAQSLQLSGGGTIARGEAGRILSADLRFTGTGVVPANPALATAVGQNLGGALTADWQEGSGSAAVRNLSLAGDDYALHASGQVSGVTNGFALNGNLRGTWGDLSVLSGLTGLPVAGQAVIDVTGSASLLGSAFDLRFQSEGTDLRFGIPEVDSALSGASVLAGAIKRDEAGIKLSDLTARSGGISAALDGTVSSQGFLLTAEFDLPNVSEFGAQYRGSASGTARYIGKTADGVLTLHANGNSLASGQPQLDRLLNGPLSLNASIAVSAGQMRLQNADLTGTALDITATGGGDGQLEVSAGLNDLGVILAEFPGTLRLAGPVRQSAGGTVLDLALEGPAQVSGRLAGTLSPSLTRAELSFRGQSQAGVLNPFLQPRYLTGLLDYDLTLNGPLSPESVSGRVNLTDGQLANPNLAFGFSALAATIDLSGGNARLTATSQVTSGGRVDLTGTARAALPFEGDLDIQLTGVTLREPRLFETIVDGTLTVTGPLIGGANVAGSLSLARTELRVPASGITGAEPIPVIRHIAEPANVRTTRQRAGLIGETAPGSRKSGGASYPLDIIISAPNQIFLRGRGIDAELGGAFQLRGTTADFRPEGSFDLIRGRLDLVGRRLILSQAQLFLEGDFIPKLDLTASSSDSDIISTIRIFGPADSPALELTSTPELPDEEILAQLLFGQSLVFLSPFQAAQLAAAVATLAGRGGEGLVGKIRNRTGLDNLDIVTPDDGNARLTAGKYLSDKIYSEVSIDQTGKTQIDLNLDVRPHVTLKGSLESNGNSGFGIFLEKNY